MKTNIKKSLKFLTLLISALLIGTASAAIYNYMQINATVGVKGFDVNFYAGEDTSKAGGTITPDRQGVSFSNIKGLPGKLVTYSDSVRICNNDTTAHKIKLEIENPQYSEYADDHLDYIKITIYDSNNATVDSLQLDPNNDNGGDDLDTAFNSLTYGSNGWWRVQWDILWLDAATQEDTVSITLKITVES